jgi:hypothetical protein
MSDDFPIVEKSGLFALESKLEQREYTTEQFNKELDGVLDTLHGAARASISELLLSVGKALEPLCKLASKVWLTRSRTGRAISVNSLRPIQYLA